MKKRISKEEETPLKPGCLTANELKNAEVVLVKYVQAKEYPDWINYVPFSKDNKRSKRDFFAVEVESIFTGRIDQSRREVRKQLLQL